ncbi:hypothetical protein SS50377_23776 [Spironucleus salmonicida]|uniref:Thioredoxin-like domain-containing protein n=1 Tax=Spironucleus salmonicida TaxID=348837 RepID=V6M013_9EUKA|nr:hypothetical protein SS50377_23776 [Spironucleus salmonicida]|eukprot:EST46454.1 hypothetical protein SS50377_13538 [Spironucleus salmonicida]
MKENLPPLYFVPPLVFQPQTSRNQSPIVKLSNTITSRSKSLPDIDKVKIINNPVPRLSGSPIALVSFITTSTECQMRMPYVVQLQKLYPKIFFLLISVQKLDVLVKTFMEIPELLYLNIACDQQGVFRSFLSQYSQMGLPHVFAFDENESLIFDGQPQSPELKSKLSRIQGKFSIQSQPRKCSPSRIMEMKQMLSGRK